ncbi:MAG: hypothetical protein N4A47_02310 [Clostridia bacterium]|jgi:hypothetical protein|nr:hypothetical protein [Clostridia bacterium]
MENINEQLLKENLKDSTNKQKTSSECDNTMLQLFKIKTKLYYHIKNNMFVYELSQWLISFNNYLNKKNGNSHTKKYKQGQEIIVDLGFAYGDELAYKHHCIVLSQKKSKIFVVPLTSKTIRGYEPGTTKVKSEYAIAGTAEGFKKEGIVLLLNDSRWISLNRIITHCSNQINANYLDTIKNMILQRTLGSIHTEKLSMKSRILKLEKALTKRDSDIIILKEKLEELEKLNDIYKTKLDI